MAEGSSSILESNAQRTIDSQVGMIPEFNTHTPLHPINDPNIKKFQPLIQNNNTHITNFTNSSQISPIVEQKQEKIVGFEGKNQKPKRAQKKKKGLKRVQNYDFERSSVCDCDKRGDRKRIMYLKEEIEGLRFLGFEEQKKKWIEVYCGLESDVCKEYDCLVSCKNDDQGNYVNFDPRVLFADKLGVSADNVGNESENIGSEMQNTNKVDHLSGVIVSDVEEDYCEDEEYVSIQRPAFYVTGEPDFDSGPPQDGLEYLRRVRWEVEHIPKVKIAKAERNVLKKEQTVYMPNIPDIAPCPAHLMPSKEWEDVFLADFSNLRLALSQNENYSSTFSGNIDSIPLAQSIIENVIQDNLDFCQTDDGTIEIQENIDSSQTEDNTTIGDLPNLQTIMETEPVARVKMLRKRISSMDTKSSLGRPDCAWLFALCAAIDTPLDGDTSASLRCLLRKCANLRAEKTSLDDEVIMLNILVTVSGKYFGQLETV